MSSDERRFTLEEARRYLAREQCAANGHTWEVVETFAGPRRIVCECGESYDVLAGELAAHVGELREELDHATAALVRVEGLPRYDFPIPPGCVIRADELDAALADGIEPNSPEDLAQINAVMGEEL